MSGLRDRSRRSRWMACFVVAAAALGVNAASAVAAPHVEIVTQGAFPGGPTPSNTHYFHGIQEAVEATKKGDWVLIEPGDYKEEVKVTSAHSHIHIRGMNRNEVILDGQNEVVPGGRNGLEVIKADDVWVENMTSRNFERECLNENDANCENESAGNEFWWTGGDGSGKVGARGWWGRYLTAYATGADGGYGIFAQNETIGAWEHIYASGFNDSGIYIGACQECKALVNDATIENNAVGYSGSNSGGELVIENSVFKHNSSGIAPNGENPGDPPPPSDGECHRHNVAHPNPTPHFSSTDIERCEIFRKNLITENDNLTAPANPSTIKAPFGAGILLPGTYAMDIEENTISDNPSDGVMAFEYPNPFPPQESTIYFQLAGNKIAKNVFENNGYEGGFGAGDIFMQGGLYGAGKSQSTMNCIGTGAEANTFADKSVPSQTELETTWGCQNATTPNPNEGPEAIGYILENQEKSEDERTPTDQPPPGEQETMPHPCAGVPADPLCPTEESEPYSRRNKAKSKHS
jgi:hypothetical protein